MIGGSVKIYNCLMKLNIYLFYDSAIPLVGIYPREMKLISIKRHVHMEQTTADLFRVAKSWKQPMPINRVNG